MYETMLKRWDGGVVGRCLNLHVDFEAKICNSRSFARMCWDRLWWPCDHCTLLSWPSIHHRQDLSARLCKIMRAQKCEFSYGMVAKLDEQFYLTCPVTSVKQGRQQNLFSLHEDHAEHPEKSYPKMCGLAAAEQSKLVVSASSQKTLAGCQSTRGD